MTGTWGTPDWEAGAIWVVGLVAIGILTWLGLVINEAWTCWRLRRKPNWKRWPR